MEQRFIVARKLRAKKGVRLSSLDEAIEYIIPAEDRKKLFKGVHRTDYIEKVAQYLRLSPARVLREVAFLLGMQAVTTLTAPTQDTLDTLGLKPSFLKKKFTVPLPYRYCPQGFALIVADPSVVKLEEFNLAGFPIFLSLGSAVTKAWDDYYHTKKNGRVDKSILSVDIPEKSLRQALHFIAEESQTMGASSCVIGIPDKNTYSFLQEEERYVGNINRLIFNELLVRATATKHLRLIEKELKLDVEAKYGDGRIYFELTWKEYRKNVSTVSLSDSISKEISAKPFFLPQRLQGLSILYLGDWDDFSSSIKETAKTLDAEFTHLASSKDTISYLQLNSEKFDLAMLELSYPLINNKLFVETLEKVLDIPILAVTKSNQPIIPDSLVSLGMQLMVNKTEPARAVLAKCERYLSEIEEERKILQRAKEVIEITKLDKPL